MGSRARPRGAVPHPRRADRGGRFRPRRGPADGADHRRAGDAEAQRPDPAGLRPVRDPRSLRRPGAVHRTEEHTSELQSLMRISYDVYCLTKKNYTKTLSNRQYTLATSI